MTQKMCTVCNEKANNRFKCEKCNKYTHSECIGITACQTEWCICRNCFDYKCCSCKKVELPHSEVYFTDCKPTPVCHKCYKKYYNGTDPGHKGE